MHPLECLSFVRGIRTYCLLQPPGTDVQISEADFSGQNVRSPVVELVWGQALFLQQNRDPRGENDT